MNTNKSKRGGPDRGQGRKRKNPDYGARVQPTFRIRPDHAEALAGRDAAEYVDTGLSITIPALGHTAGSDACLIAYHAVSEAIQRLERIRDYNPETHQEDGGYYWSPDESALHAYLSGVWDELRRSLLFTEPELPAEPWEK